MLDRFSDLPFDISVGSVPFAVVAPALIVLLMYALHRTSIGKFQDESADERRERATAVTELRSVQKDQSLLQLENQILREFLSQGDDSRAIDLLLRRFVPNSRSGFIALFRPNGNGLSVTKSRGLSAKSLEDLRLDADLLTELTNERFVLLQNGRLFHSPLLGQLAKEDRGNVEQICLAAIGDGSELDGVLMTTSLCPIGAPREQQIDLTCQLMTSIAGTLRRMATSESQQHQLQLKKEMLELRSITDRKYAEPTQMVEDFLARLIETIGAQRVALYLWRQNAVSQNRALVRCGVPLQPAIDARWTEHEDALARIRLNDNAVRTFDQDELQQLGINTLVASAMAAPLMKNHTVIGVVCFTTGSRLTLTESQQALARWACEFLADRMHRAFNEVVVERQAHQDGLTQLANRRTFDQRIRGELERVRQSGEDCSLLLCDLDRFKQVNDTYGHQAGDEVLRVTARLISAEIAKIRTADQPLIARYGGEEMAVLLPGFGVVGAQRIAESIRAVIEATSFRSSSHRFQVTTSIGIAACPQHAASVNNLIAAADAALYQAKKLGRNRVCCATEIPV